MINLEERVWEISSKIYQNRSPKQHKILQKFLSNHFIDSIPQKIKLLEFYIKQLVNQTKISSDKYSRYSFIIKFHQNQTNESISTLIILDDNKTININQQQKYLIIDYNDYLTCQALKDTTIQQQISFLRSSQYLCSLPKNIYYQILKNASVRSYNHSKTIYDQNQMQNGQSYIFIVREGQFCYRKYIHKERREVQVMCFKEGHCFGTLDIDYNCRQFTAYCKSNHGRLYMITKQFYKNTLKKYTQDCINRKEKKLLRYIQIKNNLKISQLNQEQQIQPKHINKIKNTTFYETKKSLSFHQTHSQLLPTLYFLNTKRSQAMANDFLKNTTYISLQKGPLRAYPSLGKRANFTDSQFRETSYLMKSCEKNNNVKIQLGNNTRGNTMFRILMRNQKNVSYLRNQL